MLLLLLLLLLMLLPLLLLLLLLLPVSEFLPNADETLTTAMTMKLMKRLRRSSDVWWQTGKLIFGMAFTSLSRRWAARSVVLDWHM